MGENYDNLATGLPGSGLLGRLHVATLEATCILIRVVPWGAEVIIKEHENGEALQKALVDAMALEATAQGLIDSDFDQARGPVNWTKLPIVSDVDDDFTISKLTKSAFEILKRLGGLSNFGIVVVEDSFRWRRNEMREYQMSQAERKDWKLHGRYYFARLVGRVSDEVALIQIDGLHEAEEGRFDWVTGRYRIRSLSLVHFPSANLSGTLAEMLGRMVLTPRLRESVVDAFFEMDLPHFGQVTWAALESDIAKCVGNSRTRTWLDVGDLASQLNVKLLELALTGPEDSRSEYHVVVGQEPAIDWKGEIVDAGPARYLELRILRRYPKTGLCIADISGHGESQVSYSRLQLDKYGTPVFRIWTVESLVTMAYVMQVGQVVTLQAQTTDGSYVVVADGSVLPKSAVRLERNVQGGQKTTIWILPDTRLSTALFSSGQEVEVILFLESGEAITSNGAILEEDYWTQTPKLRERLHYRRRKLETQN